MGDLVLRVSLLVQRGYLCESCGVVIDGDLAQQKRSCSTCSQRGGENGLEASLKTSFERSAKTSTP